MVSGQTVINTWPFTEANDAAWGILENGGSALDAITTGMWLNPHTVVLTSSTKPWFGYLIDKNLYRSSINLHKIVVIFNQFCFFISKIYACSHLSPSFRQTSLENASLWQIRRSGILAKWPVLVTGVAKWHLLL